MTSAVPRSTLSHDSRMLQNRRSGESKRPFCSLSALACCFVVLMYGFCVCAQTRHNVRVGALVHACEHP